jgi:hypothetical protein
MKKLIKQFIFFLKSIFIKKDLKEEATPMTVVNTKPTIMEYLASKGYSRNKSYKKITRLWN